ncbi:MAG: methylenetetrahydrofolate reductase [NAD(P)H] [Candidatus Omnitrophica bacterium]|nr:methylenetetrahydrofolate reductase [NAD(P)H] [Candidatus Omnitrophota bacterium]
MKLHELYKTKKVDISIELFPPKTEEGVSEMFREVERLNQYNPAFFSMTYGAAGTTRDLTLDLSDRLKNKIKVETMCHLTVVGQSRDEIHHTLEFLKKKGIYNLIALRGDPPQGAAGFEPHPNGFRYARDLVREVKRMNYFSIAVAGFPEKHPDSQNRESDIKYLKEKVEAGADVIITQLFFDNRYFYEYLDQVRKARIKVPVIPGILPILSAQQVRRFTALCKSKIPLEVEAALGKFENDPEGARKYGIELAMKQCQDLLKNGVKGLHFYSLNKAHSVEAVLQNLGF